MWYAFDNARTGNSVSLKTRVKAVKRAQKGQIQAMNETERQPSINLEPGESLSQRH